MMPIKHSLIATATRSYDNYHISNNKTHLIMSVAYLNYILTKSQLVDSINSSPNLPQPMLLIRIINDFNIVCIEDEYISDKIKLYTYSLGYLISNYTNSNKLSLLLNYLYGDNNSTLDNNIIGPIDLLNLKKGNVYFIFESISWINVKHIFNQLNIDVSGGSISKRQYISITDMKLFILLSKINNLFKHTEFIHLSKNVYNQIKYNLNKGFYSKAFIDQLYEVLQRELIDTATELKLLSIYVESDLRGKKKGIMFSSEKEERKYFKTSESKINKYKDIILELNYLYFYYSIFTKILSEEWNNKFNDLDEKLDVDMLNLLKYNPNAYTNLLQQNNELSLIGVMVTLYPQLYERRLNLIVKKNYFNYINLILDQKKPSYVINGYDFRNRFKDIPVFESNFE